MQVTTGDSYSGWERPGLSEQRDQQQPGTCADKTELGMLAGTSPLPVGATVQDKTSQPEGQSLLMAMAPPGYTAHQQSS